MLSGTRREFLRGPRGTGFLYVRESFLDRIEPPFLDLNAARWTGPDSYVVRDDARRFENWETNYAGKIGLGVAARHAAGWGCDGIGPRQHGIGPRRFAVMRPPGRRESGQ